MKHTRETTSFLKIRNLCKRTQFHGTNSRSYDRFRQCLGYSTLGQVQEMIDDGKPLSVLQESQFIRDVVYVVISGNNCVHLHKINYDDEGGQCLYNL